MSDIIPETAPQSKQCNRCKQFLPLTNFTVDRNKKDGLRTICKVCSKTPVQPLSPVPEGFKRCRDCKQIKPASTEFFNKTATYQSADGLNRQCIECRKKYRKERNADAPKVIKPKHVTRFCPDCEQHLPATLEYFSYNKSTGDRLAHQCKECMNKKSKQYRARPGGKEKRQAYRKMRFEHDKTYHKVYREQHQEHERAYRKQYRLLHQEHCREYRKQYHLSHKDERRAHTLNRIARKKQVLGNYTDAQIQEQLKRQRYRCYYAACGHTKFEKRKGKYVYHVDHTFPLSRVAGSTIPANDISYLVLACPKCNMSKSDKYPWEWPEGGRLL